jgi:EAL domain-containing protein (putative c-di-GMP-specific phosphodiesterase class I)
MVSAIVGVAQGLGIEAVAESVTDDETIRLLREHGVDYAQGFHVGRPGPVAAMALN